MNRKTPNPPPTFPKPPGPPGPPGIGFLWDQLRTLRLKPGDVIVLMSEAIMPDGGAYITDRVKKIIKGHQVLVLDEGIKIGVVRKEGNG